jgi:hypothetical protein
MKIREGAYYRTRGGDVVGPMQFRDHASDPWYTNLSTWREGGRIWQGNGLHDFDLISEVYVSDTPPADAPAPEVKTLRDEFAGYAIIGLLAAGDCHAFNREEMAAEAYKQADAMLEARKKCAQ